jgi:hypothetical protein
MFLEAPQLLDMADVLMSEMDSDRLVRILFKMNSTGRLREFLEDIGYSHLLPSEGMSASCVGDRYPNGKIIVVGASEVKQNVLLAVAKEHGFSKDRFDLLLEYYDCQKYDFGKTRNNSKYALVLFGPVPHSGTSKEDAGSVISKLETPGGGYPPVIRLGSNGLRISKSNFADALEKAVSQGFITKDLQ